MDDANSTVRTISRQSWLIIADNNFDAIILAQLSEKIIYVLLCSTFEQFRNHRQLNTYKQNARPKLQPASLGMQNRLEAQEG